MCQIITSKSSDVKHSLVSETNNSILTNQKHMHDLISGLWRLSGSVMQMETPLLALLKPAGMSGLCAVT